MTDADRQGIQAEVDALTEEITRIAEETTFAGADMLNGKASVVRFQVGPDPSSIVEIDLTTPMDVDGLAKLAAFYAGTEQYKLYEKEVTNATGGTVMCVAYANFTDIFNNKDSDAPGINVS